MTGLRILWEVALVLAAASLAVMLFLILRRIVLDRRAARWQAAKKNCTRLVLQHLSGGPQISAAPILDNPAALRALPEIAGQLFQLVRGEDEKRVVSLLAQAGVIDRLIQASRDRQPHRRLQAVESLAHIRTEQATTALQEALSDSHPQIGLAAAMALCDSDDLPALPELIGRLGLGSASNRRVHQKLFRALVPRRNDELLALLRSDPAPGLKLLAMDALGHSGDYQILPELITIVEDPDPELRIGALRAFNHLNHPKAKAAILKCLDDSHWAVRTQAATCCGAIGFKEALPRLVALLSDAEWWPRYRAAEALAKLGNEGIERLQKSLDGDRRAADVAEAVLFKTGQRL